MEKSLKNFEVFAVRYHNNLLFYSDCIQYAFEELLDQSLRFPQVVLEGKVDGEWIGLVTATEDDMFVMDSAKEYEDELIKASPIVLM